MEVTVGEGLSRRTSKRTYNVRRDLMNKDTQVLLDMNMKKSSLK